MSFACDQRGSNLIFLVSQPRAGSTLLQRILGAHPEIHTVGEPWLMLHPLHALKASGYRADYDEAAARQALGYFLDTLPHGSTEYVEAVRYMAAYLYGRALEVSGKRLFLDKTPRYYFVIPELLKVFPSARFIVLFRNPLSVLYSMMEAWTEPTSSMLTRKVVPDLIEAPKLLVDGVAVLGSKATTVKYEELVADPESQIRRLCDALNVGFHARLIDYGNSAIPRWKFGDQRMVYSQTRPVGSNVCKWVTACDNPQVWRLLHDYVQLLGPDLLRSMGYSREQLLTTLDQRRPTTLRLSFTYGLSWWIGGAGIKPTAATRAFNLPKRALINAWATSGVTSAGTITLVSRVLKLALVAVGRALRARLVQLSRSVWVLRRGDQGFKM